MLAMLRSGEKRFSEVPLRWYLVALGFSARFTLLAGTLDGASTLTYRGLLHNLGA